MTGNILIDNLISLGAIAAMVAFAWAMFRAPVPLVTQARAADRLAFDEPDFEPEAWLLDEKGRAALATGRAGDVAIVFALGTDLVTRRFTAHGVMAEPTEGGVIIRPNDPGAREITLISPDAAQWARKLKT